MPTKAPNVTVPLAPRCPKPPTSEATMQPVLVRADVLEAIRRYARPGDTDGDIIARMVWAATRPGGSVR